MLAALQILAVMLAAVALTPALAHALEFPGKLRLSKEEYLTVQPIYYPGFTIGGFVEIGALFALVLLLVFAPKGEAAHWLTAGAFVLFLAAHATYWLVTHPVNKVWLKDTETGRAGSRFFSLGAVGGEAGEPASWEALRDRWEQSHIVRAGLFASGLLLLTTAAVLTR